MIYLLHGEDKTAAYIRLEQIIKTYPKAKRLHFSKENTRDDLYMAIFGTTLLEDENILVAHNFLKDKKLTVKDEIFKNTPKDTTIVFWEQAEIAPAQIKSIALLARVETFKPRAFIFQFLDTLSPDAKRSLSILRDLEYQQDPDPAAYSYPLIWHISARLILLTLAKLGASASQAGQISGRNLAPWQWDKIKNQANLFELKTLKNFLTGSLKADLAIKTGKTGLEEPELTAFLMLKYLRS
ncbi:MAG: hypothetical protein Q7S45_01985 [Candidatus Curtissbacteria bacterium]|nr:hypothetical protein [Candidatus Curtissbacteria bacterium]